MKFQQSTILNKVGLCLILLFIGLMSASVTHAESYTFVTNWGSYGSSDGQFDGLDGIAIDSSGNVYVADTGNHRIQKFDSSGAYITKWGSYGSNEGQFSSPSDVAVDSSGDVYVADMNNNRIQKFDSIGNCLTKWGSEGSSDGQFQGPAGIAVDSSGNVYVVDGANSRIQKFDSNGNYLTQWGSNGMDDGQFWQNPSGVAVDSLGSVYVADYGNGRIQKFDSSGKFLTKWISGGYYGELSTPTCVAIDSSGNVYVGNRFFWIEVENYIVKFDSNGEYITEWGSSGSGDGQFHYLGGIAVDSLGNIYVADMYNHRIQKFALEEPSLIKPIASFSASPTSGAAPLKVQFTDNSSGNPTSWNWNFGDGATSVEKSPEHTYNAAGTYTVNLTVSNANGTDSKLAIINVLKPILPVFPGYTNPPQDLDQDGLYEDINGNGMLDFDDVVAYYDNMEWIEQNAPIYLFDYNNNGLIDFDDVVKLYDML